MVIDNLRSNAELAQRIVAMTAERIAVLRPPSRAHHALRHALMTPQEAVPAETRQRTALFTAPYWDAAAATGTEAPQAAAAAGLPITPAG